MKSITNKELELLVKNLVDGKITRKALAGKLETDLRTLHKVILRMAEINPALYEEYVEKFPYKPKAREDIDYEALIIYAVKREKTLKDVSLEFGVSYRTINRRIKEIQITNPELISLYREHSYHLKTQSEMSYESQIKIDALEERPVVKSSITKYKEDELTDTLKKFEKLLSEGFSKAEAARRLGFADHTAIWKKYEWLKRIKTEEGAKHKYSLEGAKQGKSFKESLKVQPIVTNNKPTQVEAKTSEAQTSKTENETPEEAK